MKNFKDSAQTSHAWANKLEPEGGTRIVNRMDGSRGRQAFFEGDTYYSYGRHYVIGCHLPDGSVAINLESNSATTNGHVREAIYAVRPRKVLRVFNPGGEPDSKRTERHVQWLIEKAAAAKPNGKRPKYLAEAQTVADDYNAFCVSLDLADNPNFPMVSAATDEAELERMRKLQREYAAEEREREKKRQAENARRRAERIPEWRAGGYVPAMHDLPTMLRLSLARDEDISVETSRGAHIPVDDAKRLWPVIQRVMKGDRDYEVGMQLGHYRLTKINRDGSIVVGCHDIEYPEIEGIAKQLGLVSLEAEETA